MSFFGNRKFLVQAYITVCSHSRQTKYRSYRYFSSSFSKRISCLQSTKLFPALRNSCKLRFYSSTISDNIIKQIDDSTHNPVTSSVSGVEELPNSNDTEYLAPIVGSTKDGIEYIPPPPVPPEVLSEEITLNALGEATFQSLGLGGYFPPGLIQTLLETIHVSLNIPWWGAIILATTSFRILLFPLYISVQKATADMSRLAPGLQKIQKELNEAKQQGNTLEVYRLEYVLTSYMKDNNLKPFKAPMMVFAQAPIFISMFLALKRCADLPVESMQTGGLSWFSDLTIPDPLYLLPIFTSITMFATIKVGADGQPDLSAQSKIVRKVMYLIPFVMLPFTVNFPSAVLCYWLSTNSVSLIQAFCLRVPKVRKFLNIPNRIRPTPEPKEKKSLSGMIDGFKENMRSMRVQNEIGNRHQVDETTFKRAGLGPVIKTSKYPRPIKSSSKPMS